MATLTFTYNDDAPGAACETGSGITACTEQATIRASMEHADDGEAWSVCPRHAVVMAARNMHWVATDGEAE